MKNLKIKATSAALLLTLFAVSASAQPQQHKAPRGAQKLSAEKVAEISTDKLDQGLELTDAQESKIYAINLKYAQERESQRENRAERPTKGEAKAERPNREAMKESMQAAQDNKKAQMVEIMQVLTDEQKVDYALLISKAKCHKAPQGGRKVAHNAPKGGQPQKAPQQQGAENNPRRAQQPRE